MLGKKRMPKVSAKHSPKDTPCFYCGKKFTSKGVCEHERHACRQNPHRKKRSWGKLKCRVCGQMYHAAGLRTHMATQHPVEFAHAKARKRPSSRAAMRRRAARAGTEEVRHEASRSSSRRRSSPKDKTDRHNTKSGAMAQIQREMQRAAATN